MDAEDYEALPAPPPEPPRGLLGRLTHLARHNPMAELAQKQLQKAEARVLGELRARMERLEPPPPPPESPLEALGGMPASAPAVPAASSKPRPPPKPSVVMAELLARSQEQGKDEAQETLHSLTLRQLVPDEARILAALSDGTVHALLHVQQAPLLGAAQTVLENASSVGRAAGVRLMERVPLYMTRLRALGLVDFGPEDASLQSRYELLETEAPVVEAIRLIEDKRRASAKIQRRSVWLSAYGRELWEFSHRPFTVSGEESAIARPANWSGKAD